MIKEDELPVAVARLEHAAVLSALINSAYRGEASRKGWTTEADLLDGQRTDPEALMDAISIPHSAILLYGEPTSPVACIFLERKGDTCYLGMITVLPTLQRQGIGKVVMRTAESWAIQTWQVCKFEMTVIDKRHSLIAWYERRGYVNTRQEKPFPYGDERFGIPKTNDLKFVVLEKKYSH